MCLVYCFRWTFDQDNVAIELIFDLDYTSTSFPLLDSHLPLVSPMQVVQELESHISNFLQVYSIAHACFCHP
jgi:hypothetical protein